MAQEHGKVLKDPPAIAKRIHVPTYEEILDRIKSRYPRGGRRIIDRELARLQATYDILISKTNFIKDLVRLIDSLHPFYLKLIEIDFDISLIRNSIKCISRARKISSKLFEKYRILLLASENKRELLRVSSEARGRILSTIRKCRRNLEYLRNLVVFIQRLPSIDPTLPTLIVAGAPSSGKSTLVRAVSRSQTRVASYPFTTTTIHIGHFYIKLNENKKVKFQIIDTPGLLDRPPEEMNPVERRAVAALEELDGAILFLVDVSNSAYMDIKRQFRLLNLIINNYSSNKSIFIVLNKIDIKDNEAYAEARRIALALANSGAIQGVYELVASDSIMARRVVENIALIITRLNARRQ